MFEIKQLDLEGAWEIKSPIFKDDRGSFVKTVHKEFFSDHGLEWNFQEQFFTVSKKNVLRGMHFQTPPFDHVKLVRCLEGEALDVLLDLRVKSKTYGQTVSVLLNAEKANSVYVPRGFAHGFLSLKDKTLMTYSVSTTHEPKADSGVLWSSIDFAWNVENPIQSPRDQSFQSFKEFSSPF
jgi:dTDP-4-dehydrorhamnose 3,5-epimerase